MNRRILWSVASIFAAGALVVGATFAFFTDEETSSGNVFAAGTLNLLVDYDCYYNKTADGNPNCPWQDSSWEQTDLGPQHKFFNFDDVKPGDFGEGTISLHILDNDAWGRLVIDNVLDLENECTDSEEDAGDISCGGANGDGELRQNIPFSIWLDEGTTPGFQCAGTESGHGPCPDDPQEGDNVYQDTEEPVLITQGTVDLAGETHNIWEGLAAVYASRSCLGDGSVASDCPGLTSDGHLVGSITYYFGIDWELADSVGNEVQTDSLGADLTIEVEQYRHNATPFSI